MSFSSWLCFAACCTALGASGCLISTKDYPLESREASGGVAGKTEVAPRAGGPTAFGGDAGATNDGSLAGGVAGSNGGSAGGPTPVCSLAEAVGTDSLISKATWQDYFGKSGDCLVCADSPCDTMNLTWQYPVVVTSPTTFRAVVSGKYYTLANMRAGTCGSEEQACSVGYHFDAIFDFEAVPTASGWKIATTAQVFSVPDYPDTSPFMITIVCPTGYHAPQLTSAIADDLYAELKATLVEQEFSCP